MREVKETGVCFFAVTIFFCLVEVEEKKRNGRLEVMLGNGRTKSK